LPGERPVGADNPISFGPISFGPIPLGPIPLGPISFGRCITSARRLGSLAAGRR